MLTDLALFASRRSRMIESLFEGDPTAWTILVVVVGGSLAWGYYKKSKAKSEAISAAVKASSPTSGGSSPHIGPPPTIGPPPGQA